MSNFTGGKWSVGRNGGCVVSTESNGLTVGGATDTEYYGGNLICESVSPCNASLLAASRDLYLAAKNASVFLDALGYSSSDEYQELIASLGKAEGEASE